MVVCPIFVLRIGQLDRPKRRRLHHVKVKKVDGRIFTLKIPKLLDIAR